MNSIFSGSKSRIVTRVCALSSKGSGPYIKWSDSHWNFLCKVPPRNFKILSSDNNSKMSISPHLPPHKHGLNFPKKRCLGPRTQISLESAKCTWRPTSTRYFLRSVWMWLDLGGWRANYMPTAATLQLVTVIERGLSALLIRHLFLSKTKRMLIIE